VFAADKVAKVREMRMTLARQVVVGGRRPQPDPERLEHYGACLELLEQRLGHHPLVRQLRFELEALQLLPPE
jgi:hypothetical protein